MHKIMDRPLIRSLASWHRYIIQSNFHPRTKKIDLNNDVRDMKEIISCQTKMQTDTTEPESVNNKYLTIC